MRVFLAMIVAPLVVLNTVSVVYALVPVSCARGDNALLFLVDGTALAFCAVVTASAAALWRTRRRAAPPVELGDARARFLSGVAASVGALSVLVLGAVALPIAFLDACRP